MIGSSDLKAIVDKDDIDMIALAMPAAKSQTTAKNS